MTHGWSAGVAYYAEKRCDELEAEGKIEKKILISGDAAEMTTQLDELKTWGADAIVAFPQWEGMEVPIQQAIDEGITVVNFDIAIEADGVYRVSGDNEGMGKDAAEYIIDKVGTEGTVVVLDVPTSGSVAELRKKGFTETMAAEAPNMVLKEYATEFTREAGLSDMADILTANPQIDAVFSMDDETSIGALQAIRDAGRTDIKVITGGGGCQEWFNMMLADENQDIWLQSDLYSPVMVEDGHGSGHPQRQRPREPREDHPHRARGSRERRRLSGREFSLLIRFPADKGAMAPAIAPFPKEQKWM